MNKLNKLTKLYNEAAEQQNKGKKVTAVTIEELNELVALAYRFDEIDLSNSARMLIERMEKAQKK